MSLADMRCMKCNQKVDALFRNDLSKPGGPWYCSDCLEGALDSETLRLVEILLTHNVEPHEYPPNNPRL